MVVAGPGEGGGESGRRHKLLVRDEVMLDAGLSLLLLAPHLMIESD
jgi:hypothetical protein